MKNILVIGSGPIVIGQAAEFDYSGTQACLALIEEGFTVSLINNNPATIMTDKETADKVHIKPMNCEEIEKIIISDKIDAILPNCGGQTALNLAIELEKKGILKKHNVMLLGVNLETIEKAENRQLFKELMEEIGEPVCESIIIRDLDEILSKNEKIDFFSIAKKLVSKIPEFSNLKIYPVENSGKDNRTFHIGEDFILRMTKKETSSKQIEKEFKCLPFLAKNLSVKIAEPIYFIKSSNDYEFNCGIYKYIDGEPLNSVNKLELDLNNLAKDLGKFLKKLHEMEVIEDMESCYDNCFRGSDISEYDCEMQDFFNKFRNKIDTSAFEKIWNRAKSSKWEKNPVWIHGDLAIGNILIKDKKLEAIIDFGQIATGDPACDLVMYLTFFDKESREIFKSEINLDEDTWDRARGWALWKALLWPVENRDENIRILNNILEDYDSKINFSPKYDCSIEVKSRLNNISFLSDFPLIIRPSLTLGGTGGGIANNQEELLKIVKNGLKLSPIGEVLVEKSIYGWKEIEYEIVRDSNDTCIAICNMENFDPVGVHTGDSIVVAPSQTLNDKQYQMLRSAAIKIVRALKIEGACNVQFGLHSKTNEYIVIEVNPRVSRSSALASKATAYPIAKVAAKIATGKKLHEIKNDISGITAVFEPSLDYIVCKVPTFPFDKFPNAPRTLGTQMKATGEYMGIGLTFEESFLKCISKSEIAKEILKIKNFTTDFLLDKIKTATDKRIFEIIELLQRDIAIEKIAKIIFINEWFLIRLKNILDFDSGKKSYFRSIDGSAGEFNSKTNYIYSTVYSENHEIKPLNTENSKRKIIILGSSAIKIGQGIEFDYASVHAVKSLKKLGYSAIMINNNPETISTDYNLADRLYFEPIETKIVKEIYDFEKADGILLQFGGQTAINIAKDLDGCGLKILGTDVRSLEISEDRQKFNDFLSDLNVKQPNSLSFKIHEIKNEICKINFPVMVRPSYVIGGSKMKICKDIGQLDNYLADFSNNEIIFIDEFIDGIEYEVDLVSNGRDAFVPLIAEHVEPSGVHSGDSQVFYPAKNIDELLSCQMKEICLKIVEKLNIVGLMNVQFVVKNNEIYVIEINLRSSRTIPVINKVCDIDMVDLAIQVILMDNLKIPKYKIKPAIKKPIFSNQKITNENIALCPEMRSTGEILKWI